MTEDQNESELLGVNKLMDAVREWDDLNQDFGHGEEYWQLMNLNYYLGSKYLVGVEGRRIRNRSVKKEAWLLNESVCGFWLVITKDDNVNSKYQRTMRAPLISSCFKATLMGGH